MARRFPLVTALLMSCLNLSAAWSQNPAGPVLIEPGPVVESTLFDGSTVYLETQTVSRLVCGSEASNVTLDELREIVARGRAAFAASGNVVTVDGHAVPRNGWPRTGLEIVFNIADPPVGATAALDAAAAYLETLFVDPITVTIDVSFADLGSEILGSTSNNYTGSSTWSSVRAGLIADMDENDAIQISLPAGEAIPVRYDGTSDTITNEDRVFFSRANFNAAIGSQDGTAATMQFNNTFPWDYDPSDGVGTSICFQSVVLHEIGHVLGFTSGADFRTEDIEALDLYRFQRTDGNHDYNPDTEAEFQTTARLVDNNVPDDDHNSDLIAAEYRMADGDPDQASHFRQGSVDGIMQPPIGAGTTFYPNFYRAADIAMLDAIGWHYPPIPPPPPPSVQAPIYARDSFVTVTAVILEATVVVVWVNGFPAGFALVDGAATVDVTTPFLFLPGPLVTATQYGPGGWSISSAPVAIQPANVPPPPTVVGPIQAGDPAATVTGVVRNATVVIVWVNDLPAGYTFPGGAETVQVETPFLELPGPTVTATQHNYKGSSDSSTAVIIEPAEVPPPPTVVGPIHAGDLSATVTDVVSNATSVILWINGLPAGYTIPDGDATVVIWTPFLQFPGMTVTATQHNEAGSSGPSDPVIIEP